MTCYPSCIERFKEVIEMDKEKKLFLCFCATLVLPVLEMKYPYIISYDDTTEFYKTNKAREILSVCQRFINGDATSGELMSAYAAIQISHEKIYTDKIASAYSSAISCIFYLVQLLIMQAEDSHSLIKIPREFENTPEKLADNIISLVLPSVRKMVEYSSRTHANASQAIAGISQSAAYMLKSNFNSKKMWHYAEDARLDYNDQYHAIEIKHEQTVLEALTLADNMIDKGFAIFFPNN